MPGCSGLNGGNRRRPIADAAGILRDAMFQRFDPPVVFAALDHRLMAFIPTWIDFQTNAAAWMTFRPGANKNLCINNRAMPQATMILAFGQQRDVAFVFGSMPSGWYIFICRSYEGAPASDEPKNRGRCKCNALGIIQRVARGFMPGFRYEQPIEFPQLWHR